MTPMSSSDRRAGETDAATDKKRTTFHHSMGSNLMAKKPTDLEKPGDSYAILLYSDPEGEVHMEAFFQHETLWLTQKRMGELFGRMSRGARF